MIPFKVSVCCFSGLAASYLTQECDCQHTRAYHMPNTILSHVKLLSTQGDKYTPVTFLVQIEWFLTTLLTHASTSRPIDTSQLFYSRMVPCWVCITCNTGVLGKITQLHRPELPRWVSPFPSWWIWQMQQLMSQDAISTVVKCILTCQVCIRLHFTGFWRPYDGKSAGVAAVAQCTDLAPIKCQQCLL